jgi:Cu+-exporting ATPase
MDMIDPVFKMTIEDEDTAATSDYDGVTYYFCSKVCKENFEHTPDSFTGGGIALSENKIAKKGVPYTCPMP